MSSIFDDVRHIIQTNSELAPSRLTEHYSCFPMPEGMTYQQREMLAATARAVNPHLQVNEATLKGRFDFNTPYEKPPVQQMLKKLEEIEAEVKRSFRPTNDGGLEFIQSAESLPLVELEYVLRAALPYPTPLRMEYQLPEGKVYYNHDQPVTGKIDLDTLCWLKEHADRNFNHDATAELCALRAERIVVRPEDKERVSQLLGLNAPAKGRAPGAA